MVLDRRNSYQESQSYRAFKTSTGRILWDCWKTEAGRDDCLESNAAASVHFETGTRDHVRFVRTEKERSIGHVFRLTQAAPRNT